MKIELRIPAQEQYAYIGLELADNEILTDEMIHEAVSNYRRATDSLKGIAGLPEKEFSAILDEYLTKKTIVNGQESYQKMSPKQQDVIQAIKRSYQRLKR